MYKELWRAFLLYVQNLFADVWARIEAFRSPLDDRRLSGSFLNSIGSDSCITAVQTDSNNRIDRRPAIAFGEPVKETSGTASSVCSSSVSSVSGSASRPPPPPGMGMVVRRSVASAPKRRTSCWTATTGPGNVKSSVRRNGSVGSSVRGAEAWGSWRSTSSGWSVRIAGRSNDEEPGSAALTLLLAIPRGDARAVKTALEGDDKPDVASLIDSSKNSNGLSVLHQAAFYGNPEVVHRLCQFINPEYMTATTSSDQLVEPSENASTLPSSAIPSSSSAMLSSSLEQRGSWVQQQSGEGLSIEGLKRASNRLRMMCPDEATDSYPLKEPVGACDSINCRGASGCTPLHIACSQGNLGAARILINAGANVNARTNLDSTPLILAASNSHHALCELLVSKGADAAIVNSLGASAANYHTLRNV